MIMSSLFVARRSLHARSNIYTNVVFVKYVLKYFCALPLYVYPIFRVKISNFWQLLTVILIKSIAFHDLAITLPSQRLLTNCSFRPQTLAEQSESPWRSPPPQAWGWFGRTHCRTGTSDDGRGNIGELGRIGRRVVGTLVIRWFCWHFLKEFIQFRFFGRQG